MMQEKDKFDFTFRVGNNPVRAKYKGKACRVLARGAKNTILIEFEDGHKMATSRYFIVRKK